MDKQALDERRIADLIDELAPEEPFGGEEEAEERRALREVAGLLPYALVPQEPSPAVRGRILERVAPSPARSGGTSVVAIPRRAGSAPPLSRWLLPLAASLAGVLAGVAAWQGLRASEQRQAIAVLEQRLEAARLEGGELEEARTLIARRGEQVAMLTEPGAEFCILRPAGERPIFPHARATMVVGADRDHWFLRGERLDPCDQGRAYKIWFVTESGPVAGPSFRVDGPNAEIEIAAAGLPEDLVTISITLEHDPDCERPEGPQVLRASPPMKLL